MDPNRGAEVDGGEVLRRERVEVEAHGRGLGRRGVKARGDLVVGELVAGEDVAGALDLVERDADKVSVHECGVVVVLVVDEERGGALAVLLLGDEVGEHDVGELLAVVAHDDAVLVLLARAVRAVPHVGVGLER